MVILLLWSGRIFSLRGVCVCLTGRMFVVWLHISLKEDSRMNRIFWGAGSSIFFIGIIAARWKCVIIFVNTHVMDLIYILLFPEISQQD